MEEKSLTFEDLTLIQKINKIDKIIDEKVRDFLQSDGGDCELIDVKDTNGLTDVYISYMGACGSCDSSGGTLKGIERILNGQLETNTIRMYTV